MALRLAGAADALTRGGGAVGLASGGWIRAVAGWSVVMESMDEDDATGSAKVRLRP